MGMQKHEVGGEIDEKIDFRTGRSLFDTGRGAQPLKLFLGTSRSPQIVGVRRGISQRLIYRNGGWTGGGMRRGINDGLQDRSQLATYVHNQIQMYSLCYVWQWQMT